MIVFGVCVKVDAAHVVAVAAGPAQVDVGGAVGARHLDPVRGEIGVEIAAFGEAAGDAGLAGFVQRVVEDVAGVRRERAEVLLQVAVAAAFAEDRDVGVAHAHRLAGHDGDRDGDAGIVARCASTVIVRRVVAERFQRLAGFALGLAHQVAEAPAGHVLADRIDQRQRDAHVLGHGLVEAADVDLAHRRRIDGAAGEQEQDCGGDAGEGGGHAGQDNRRVRQDERGLTDEAPARRRELGALAMRQSQPRCDRSAFGQLARECRQVDRCSIAATLPRRSARRLSRARRLLRTAHVVDVDHHAVEERIDLRAQPREAAERGDVIAVRERVAGVAVRGLDRFGQRAFRRFLQQRRIDRRGDLAVDLAQDVVDALVGGGQRLGFRQRGEGADGVDAAVEVVQRVRAQFGDGVEVLRSARPCRRSSRGGGRG